MALPLDSESLTESMWTEAGCLAEERPVCERWLEHVSTPFIEDSQRSTADGWQRSFTLHLAIKDISKRWEKLPEERRRQAQHSTGAQAGVSYASLHNLV